MTRTHIITADIVFHVNYGDCRPCTVYQVVSECVLQTSINLLLDKQKDPANSPQFISAKYCTSTPDLVLVTLLCDKNIWSTVNKYSSYVVSQ